MAEANTKLPEAKCACGKITIKKGLDFVWTMDTGVTHWRTGPCTSGRQVPAPGSPQGEEEGGPGASPMDLAWARSLVEQTRTAEVACFVKQLGRLVTEDGTTTAPYHGTKDPARRDPSEWPADLRVQQWPEVTSG